MVGPFTVGIVNLTIFANSRPLAYNSKITRTIFSYSMSEKFWKQNTNIISKWKICQNELIVVYLTNKKGVCSAKKKKNHKSNQNCFGVNLTSWI